MSRKKYFYVLLGCAVAFAILRGLFFGNEKPVNAVSVSASSVIQKNVTIKWQTIGTVEAYSTVDIKSMVTGPLLQTGFQEGDVVEKDQILFTIDPRSFQAALDQAKANLARDQAMYQNAKLQVERNTPLLKKGYVSKQDFDTLESNLESLAATLQADEAAVASADLDLKYTTIRAPIPGKTGNIALKAGSIIKANDTLTLVTINQINPVYVAFSVPQAKFPLVQETLRKGPIKIFAIVNKDVTEEGNVTFVDNNIDTTTGTIELKATFENKQRRLWPGQYVTVDVPVDHIQQALLIPSLALLTGQNGFYVYVIDDESTAHIRYVTPGSIVDDQTVITKGLNPGEKVVTGGQLRLKEGSKVKIMTT